MTTIDHSIDAAGLELLLADGTDVKLLDVRSPAEFEAAHAKGLDVARLHSGDLSVLSAVGEQFRRLDALGIPYTLTPGIPAFAAAAASLKRELTLPEVSQSLVLTRTSGRASAMPPRETLPAFAATGATQRDQRRRAAVE